MNHLSMLKFSLLATSLLAPVAAQAQQAGQPAVVEEVVVTGSRVTTNLNSPTPVTAVSTELLSQTTPSNLPNALNTLPVFMGSGSSQSRTGGGNNGSSASLNLRNFGAQRNLILLDGVRIAPTNANGSVNTDIIPEMLIQRVEVVTGGASAVYGSEAVSGVVNFILDKSFEGLKYQASYGSTPEGLGQQYQAGIAAGRSLLDGRAHVEGSMRYFDQAQTVQTDLPYRKNGTAYALAGNGTAAFPYYVVGDAHRTDQALGGVITCGSNCAANGQTFTSDGILGPYDRGLPTSGGSPLLAIGGTGRIDRNPSAVGALRTFQTFGRFSYEVNDNTTAFVQVRFSRAKAFQNGPSNGIPTGSGGAARPNVFFTDNPFLTAATRAQLEAGNTNNLTTPDGVTHRAFTFVSYNPTLTGTARTLGAVDNLSNFDYFGIDKNSAITAGVNGKLFGNWDWTANYSHDQTVGGVENPANTNFQKMYASMDAVRLPNGNIVCHVSTTQFANLYPGCIASNPFGNTAMTASQYAYWNETSSYEMTNKMDLVSGSVSGDLFNLPAGPVKVAVSGEARWMDYKVVSDAEPVNVDCTGLRLCSGVTPKWFQTTLASAHAKQNVWEVGGEVNVPILKDLPLIESLSANIAGRYTDYSVSGIAKTWKVGLDYHINETFRVRATASQDIRAPTLNDLFAPRGQGVSSLNDLFTGKTADTVQVSRGNPDLQPEEARTYTAGLVFTPSFIPGFSASIDYYKITLSDAIANIGYGTQAVQNICINAVRAGGTSIYCDLATRPLPMSQDSSPANFPNFITSLSLNSATQKTEGVDAEASYRINLEEWNLPGNLTLRALAAYQPRLTNIAFEGSAPTFTAMPKGRVSLFIGYDIGSTSINVQNRWLSDYAQATFVGQTYADPRIDSFNQVDLNITHTFQAESAAPLSAFISVQNVLNELYPLAPGTNTTANPGLFYPVPAWGNVLGRFVTFGIRQKF